MSSRLACQARSSETLIKFIFIIIIIIIIIIVMMMVMRMMVMRMYEMWVMRDSVIYSQKKAASLIPRRRIYV